MLASSSCSSTVLETAVVTDLAAAATEFVLLVPLTLVLVVGASTWFENGSELSDFMEDFDTESGREGSGVGEVYGGGEVSVVVS